MGPYPVGDGNLLGPTSRVFGTTGTLDGEMGPYPVGDSTNLLGTQYFSTGYGTEALTIGSGRLNYGTTGPTVVSTTCSPMPKRRTPGVGRRAPLGAGGGGGGDGHETGGGCSNGSGIAPRDSFRRHSAHGRIVCSAASERCSENARNTQMRTATCAPHHHHQQVPVCQNTGP